MIIGIISSSPDHIQSLHGALPDFVQVTESDIISAVGVGKLVAGDKRPLLDNLFSTYGNVMISGVAMWSEVLSHHLVSTLNGTLILDTTSIQLPSERYWEYDGVKEWVTESKFLYYQPNTIYMDFDDTVQYQNQLGAILEMVANANDKRSDTTMSMEEVIKRAMEDLGIEPAIKVDSNNTTKVASSPSKLVAEQPAEVVVTPSPVTISSKEAPSKDTIISEVYLKLKDGTMALFIPSNIQLPAQVIDGREYHTLVFVAPNLGDTGLQSLKIQNDVTTASQSTSPVAPPVYATNLQQLVEQKVQLDHDIKSARAANDEARVAELRKQRRIVRRQINTIGGGANVATT